MTFALRWPDGRVEECYSPSLVVHDYLEAGRRYTVADLTARTTTALDVAAERVREKFGFACTAAAASAERVRRSAAAHPPEAWVEVVSLHPPLPGPGPTARPDGPA